MTAFGKKTRISQYFVKMHVSANFAYMYHYMPLPLNPTWYPSFSPNQPMPKEETSR